jgi:hypothetical protein
VEWPVLGPFASTARGPFGPSGCTYPHGSTQALRTSNTIRTQRQDHPNRLPDHFTPSNSKLFKNIHLYAIIPYVSSPVRTTRPDPAGLSHSFAPTRKSRPSKPLPAILTNLRSRKSFACHSYKNTRSAIPSPSNRRVCLTPPRCADSINLRPSQRFFRQTCQRITGGFHESRIF